MKTVRTLILALCVFPGCGGDGDAPGGTAARSLNQSLEDGQLIVLTRNAPTTFYEGRFGEEGVEYDMAVAFARTIGATPEFVMKESVADILDALERGEGHVAAAGLTLTQDRAKNMLVGPAYQSVRQQVVSRRGKKRPRRVEDLIGRTVGVVAKSSYVSTLGALRTDYPELSWTEMDSVGTEQLLHRVWDESLDLTVADDNIVAINRRFFPELIVAFHLTDPESLVWYFHPSQKNLRDAAGDWYAAFSDSGHMEQLNERYYGYLGQYDYVDTRTFTNRIKKRLPRYRALFEAAADEYGIRWTIPAAVAYQESHWNPLAVSPTGVRGMMMLSQPTAREMGVENRLDPEQSVHGGVKYLAQLYTRLPASIELPDRYWIALAAYNVGYGHVLDARTLANRLGRSPDKWRDLAEVLPLLAQREYFSTLKHGYARGYEPVRYVNRIRGYEDILIRRTSP